MDRSRGLRTRAGVPAYRNPSGPPQGLYLLRLLPTNTMFALNSGGAQGANSAALECPPAGTRGRDQRDTVGLDTAFPNMSFNYLFGEKKQVTTKCIKKNTVVLNSFF